MNSFASKFLNKCSDHHKTKPADDVDLKFLYDASNLLFNKFLLRDIPWKADDNVTINSKFKVNTPEHLEEEETD